MTLIDRLFGRRTADETLDLEAPEIARDPYPHYERLRAGGPVRYLPRHRAWIALGHDEVLSALLRPNLFSSRLHAAVDEVLLGADPPAHRDSRRIVSRHFGPEAIERTGGLAEDFARSLLRPRMDVVTGYAVPLSQMAAACFLGLDEDALPILRAARPASAYDHHAMSRAIDAVADRATLFAELLSDGLPEPQARSLVRLLWFASATTTERAIAHCVLRLLGHREARDPGLLQVFIEEVLRLHPPELILPRATTDKVELGGTRIAAGETILLCLAAANRDPRTFDDPAELRLDRPRRRNLSFGAGEHQCIGAALGRRVIHGALRVLVTGMPHFRAADAADDVALPPSMTCCPVASLTIEQAR